MERRGLDRLMITALVFEFGRKNRSLNAVTECRITLCKQKSQVLMSRWLRTEADH